jgi:hypothetical protein
MRTAVAVIASAALSTAAACDSPRNSDTPAAASSFPSPPATIGAFRNNMDTQSRASKAPLWAAVPGTFQEAGAISEIGGHAYTYILINPAAE